MWKYYTEWLTFLLLLAEASVVSNRAVVFSWLEIQSEVLIIIIPCIYTSLEGGIWQTEVGKHVNLLTWDIRSCWTFVPRETPEENLEGDILLMTIHFTPCLYALQLLLESKQVHKLLSLFSCLIFIPPPVFFLPLAKRIRNASCNAVRTSAVYVILHSWVEWLPAPMFGNPNMAFALFLNHTGGCGRDASSGEERMSCEDVGGVLSI